MDLTFSTSYDNFGFEQIVEFVPGGEAVPVTNQNKQEFVEKYIEWYLTTSIKDQFKPFYRGFYKAVSDDSIKLLDSDEVSKLIRGVDELNMKELEENTAYDNCEATDSTVVWFWQAIHGFSDDQKRMFLKFTTGSDRTPLRGMSDLGLTIMVQGQDDERLPSAHTCFNHLILPKYSSK